MFSFSKSKVIVVSLLLLIGVVFSYFKFFYFKTPENFPPKEILLKLRIPGYEGIRFYSDNDDSLRALLQDRIKSLKRSGVSPSADVYFEENFLSISGGGSNGAYSAGLIAGWIDSGKYPKLDIVTGISAGSMVAPFAFLGQKYKHQLEGIFTSLSTRDVANNSLIPALIGLRGSISDNTKLKNLIDGYVTDEFVADIAQEYKKGRMLLIGTSNLQAEEPVIWDIGAIAAANRPDSVELIRNIILASASIPGEFPPVLFKSEYEGKTYTEYHVDGGLTREIFLFPRSFDISEADKLFMHPPKRTAYIIRNGNIVADYEERNYTLLEIIRRTIVSLIKTQAIGDIYRISYFCKKHGIDFRLENIPSDFNRTSKEFFDKNYMQSLYNVGYQSGIKGGTWKTDPPEFP